jgi:hypothetical protein
LKRTSNLNNTPLTLPASFHALSVRDLPTAVPKILEEKHDTKNPTGQVKSTDAPVNKKWLEVTVDCWSSITKWLPALLELAC